MNQVHRRFVNQYQQCPSFTYSPYLHQSLPHHSLPLYPSTHLPLYPYSFTPLPRLPSVSSNVFMSRPLSLSPLSNILLSLASYSLVPTQSISIRIPHIVCTVLHCLSFYIFMTTSFPSSSSSHSLLFSLCLACVFHSTLC